MATKEQLGEAIGVIVGEGDVAQLTLKKVRKQLATRFPGADLQPMKVRAPQPSPERTCARTSDHVRAAHPPGGSAIRPLGLLPSLSMREQTNIHHAPQSVA